MSKDTSRRFHTPKGKPSPPDKKEMEDTGDLSEQNDNARLLHPNRNTAKGRETGPTMDRPEKLKSSARGEARNRKPGAGEAGSGTAGNAPNIKSRSSDAGAPDYSEGRRGASATGAPDYSEAQSSDAAAGDAGNGEKGSSQEGSGGAIQVISWIDRQEFEKLARHPADVCVSLYMRTGVAGAEPAAQADRHNLKRLLQEVRVALGQMKIRDVTGDVLRPAESLADDDGFWQEVPQGLAFFLAPDCHVCCRLPFDPGAGLYIHTSFILFPLAELPGTRYYYLLALSKHAARVYRATAFGMEWIKVPELPQGIADVVHFEEKGDSGAFRSADGSGTGANFHGIGEGKTSNKVNIAAYFREVDRTLREQLLRREHEPLVLAGVDYLLPIYREVNKYPQLIEPQVTGNFDHVQASSLFRQARDKMTAWQREQWKLTIAGKLDHGTAPVTSFAQDVIRAAFEGRVDTLFLDRNSDIRGRYDVS
ncbi:MAG TPA: hypothetical protein VGR89_09095, partial [Puia sp.]|nr:hypothetical protein [Puia sp.]